MTLHQFLGMDRNNAAQPQKYPTRASLPSAVWVDKSSMLSEPQWTNLHRLVRRFRNCGKHVADNCVRRPFSVKACRLKHSPTPLVAVGRKPFYNTALLSTTSSTRSLILLKWAGQLNLNETFARSSETVSIGSLTQKYFLLTCRLWLKNSRSQVICWTKNTPHDTPAMLRIVAVNFRQRRGAGATLECRLCVKTEKNCAFHNNQLGYIKSVELHDTHTWLSSHTPRDWPNSPARFCNDWPRRRRPHFGTTLRSMWVGLNGLRMKFSRSRKTEQVQLLTLQCCIFLEN